MDLTPLIPADTADIKLAHPETGAVLKDESGPVWIRVYGKDSKRYMERRFDRIDDAVEALNRAGRLSAGRTMSAEELHDQNIELLADATVGWSDNLELDGKPLPFSKENAVALYTRVAWIREQIDTAIAARAGFFTDSKKGSSNTRGKRST